MYLKFSALLCIVHKYGYQIKRVASPRVRTLLDQLLMKLACVCGRMRVILKYIPSRVWQKHNLKLSYSPPNFSTSFHVNVQGKWAINSEPTSTPWGKRNLALFVPSIYFRLFWTRYLISDCRLRWSNWNRGEKPRHCIKRILLIMHNEKSKMNWLVVYDFKQLSGYEVVNS